MTIYRHCESRKHFSIWLQYSNIPLLFLLHPEVITNIPSCIRHGMRACMHAFLVLSTAASWAAMHPARTYSAGPAVRILFFSLSPPFPHLILIFLMHSILGEAVKSVLCPCVCPQVNSSKNFFTLPLSLFLSLFLSADGRPKFSSPACCCCYFTSSSSSSSSAWFRFLLFFFFSGPWMCCFDFSLLA